MAKRKKTVDLYEFEANPNKRTVISSQTLRKLRTERKKEERTTKISFIITRRNELDFNVSFELNI